jgi:hypothetical protein
MKPLGKKGITRKAVLAILLAVVVGLVLLPFSRQTVNITGFEYDLRQCQLSAGAGSVEYHAPGVSKVGIGNFESPIPISCKTHYAEFKDDGITYGKLSAPLPEDADDIVNDEYQDVMKDFVMDRLNECWYALGSGKAKVTNKDESFGRRFCFICSEFIIDKSFTDKFGSDVPLSNMYSYARTHIYDAKEQLSSYEFLTGGADTPQTVMYDELNVGQQLSVVFQGVVGEVDGADAGSGIVDCQINGKDSLDRDEFEELGCMDDGKINGLVFGKVIDGATLTVRVVPTEDVDYRTCKTGLY